MIENRDREGAICGPGRPLVGGLCGFIFATPFLFGDAPKNLILILLSFGIGIGTAAASVDQPWMLDMREMLSLFAFAFVISSLLSFLIDVSSLPSIIIIAAIASPSASSFSNYLTSSFKRQLLPR